MTYCNQGFRFGFLFWFWGKAFVFVVILPLKSGDRRYSFSKVDCGKKTDTPFGHEHFSFLAATSMVFPFFLNMFSWIGKHSSKNWFPSPKGQTLFGVGIGLLILLATIRGPASQCCILVTIGASTLRRGDIAGLKFKGRFSPKKLICKICR